ncbi:bestrophin family ion channel [Paraburkholderia sp. BL9I2N2]|uniref:bestrophin family protein n=1 Tax=Paraburkholderia sp. BL9I2N2 TaxID=1938809 RepID=UPI00104995E2|nr:bestrophin family ion channel [Paraburkholderia sp. BL9I2N2]TCK84304.1 putative membrane protein [Paraburkholderia sp. BL9I2N2]
MIVRPAQNWIRMLFAWNGSVLQSIIPQLVFMSVVSGLAVLTHGRILGEKIPLNTTPFTLCGVALTIFLAFRNTASYERFLEARRLWGSLLISSRTLTSQMLSYIPAGTAGLDDIQLVHTLIAFIYATKHQLRKTGPTKDLLRFLGGAQTEDLCRKCYQPIAILNEIRNTLAHLHRRALVSDTQLWMFDAQINEMEKVVGGCERIASTPIPFAYGVLLHRTVYAYCVLLPFGLVDSTGFVTPLVSVFVSYTLIALEAIASEVSEPFTIAPNALALNAMTRNIERSLLELCGREIPAETKPERLYRLT